MFWPLPFVLMWVGLVVVLFGALWHDKAIYHYDNEEPRRMVFIGLTLMAVGAIWWILVETSAATSINV